MILDVFQQVPSEAWVGLAGVVFGSLLTTFGVSLTNKANLKQLKQQLEHEENLVSRRAKKERLEELYVLVSHWSNVFFGNFLTLSLVMKGQIDYNSYLDEVNASTKRDIDFNRIGMIVDIYGAELKEAYQAILDVRDEINNIELAHKKDYKHGKPGTMYLEPAANAQLKLGRACDNLKALVSTVARDV